MIETSERRGANAKDQEKTMAYEEAAEALQRTFGNSAQSKCLAVERKIA